MFCIALRGKNLPYSLLLGQLGMVRPFVRGRFGVGAKGFAGWWILEFSDSLWSRIWDGSLLAELHSAIHVHVSICGYRI